MLVDLKTPHIQIEANKLCVCRRGSIRVLFWGAIWFFSGLLVGYFGLNGLLSGRGAAWWNGLRNLIPGSVEAIIVASIFLFCGVVGILSGILWSVWNLFVREKSLFLNGRLQVSRIAAGISFQEVILITDQTLLEVIQWRGGTGGGFRFGDPTSHFRGDYLLTVSDGENTIHIGLGLSNTDARQVLCWLSDLRNARKSSGDICPK